MRRSAQIAAAGMRAAMAASHLAGGEGGEEREREGGGGEGGVSERALAAAFEHEAKRRGASRLAYPPVVAGNARACTIHYSRNDQILRNGDWLLMDAGCEFWGYASDVSRAWPVVESSSSFSSKSGLSSKSGFSPSSSSKGSSSSPPTSSSPSSASALFASGPHSDVYHALLEVHSKCVAAAVPGSSLSEIHALSVSLLAEAAAKLGGAKVRNPRDAVPALRGLSAADIAGRGGHQGPLVAQGVYPHSVGHWLGLDTHDAPLGMTSGNGNGSSNGGNGAGAGLVPNVVLTIEPGLYFPDDPGRWGRLAGVGMRLEDDVAVRGRGRGGERGGNGNGNGNGREREREREREKEKEKEEGPEVLSAGAPLLPADVAAAIDGS